MVDYEEILIRAIAQSDHHERVQEIEPAIIDAIKNTPIYAPIIEIGNREGGSAILLMWHSKGRRFYTCDAGACPKMILEYVPKFDLSDYEHFQMTQREFVTEHLPAYIGFIYFDADHNRDSVMEDVRTTIPHLVKGAIVAIDDVNMWDTLASFEGLEEISYPVDQGAQVGPHGKHIQFFKKTRLWW